MALYAAAPNNRIGTGSDGVNVDLRPISGRRTNAFSRFLQDDAPRKRPVGRS